MKTMEKETEKVEEDIVYHTEKPPNIYCILTTIIAVLIILIFAFGPVDTPYPKDTLGDKDNKVSQDYHPFYIISIVFLPLCCLYLLVFICFGWVMGPQVEEVKKVELDNNNIYAVRHKDDTGSKSRLKIFNCIYFSVVAILVTMIFVAVVGRPDTSHSNDTLSAKDKDTKVPQLVGSSVVILSILLLLITSAVAGCVNCYVWIEWEANTDENDDKKKNSIDKSGRQRDDTGKNIRLKICLIIFTGLIFVFCTDPLHFNEMSDKENKREGEIYVIVLAVTSIAVAAFAVANIAAGILEDENKEVSTQQHKKWNREYFVSEHLLEADEAKEKNLVLHKYLSKEKVYIYYDHNCTHDLI